MPLISSRDELSRAKLRIQHCWSKEQKLTKLAYKTCFHTFTINSHTNIPESRSLLTINASKARLGSYSKTRNSSRDVRPQQGKHNDLLQTFL